MILNSPYISGSLTVTGNITSQGGITISGSITSASYATTSSFATTASYANTSTSASYALTASFATTASYANTSTSASYALTASFATNATNFTASNILASNTITAQTLVVQTVTSSIVYSSGSNRFGNQLTDVQQMTGSLRVTGSGNHYILGGNVGIGTVTPNLAADGKALTVSAGTSGNNLIGRFEVQGSRTETDAAFGGLYGWHQANLVGRVEFQRGSADNSGNIIFGTLNAGTYGQRMTITSAGLVGIGTTSPTYKLEVSGSSGTFSFNPNQASTMVIRGSVAGNFDINNEGASGVMRLYGTTIQLRTAALDPAVTITAAGGLQTNLSTISSYYSAPGNVINGGNTTFVYNQTSGEYAVAFEYCIIGLYAPSGTNLYGIAHGFAYFMADGSTNASYISQNIANGWSAAVSATNGGVFTITFTNGGGATMSNINIRTRKVNRIGAG